MTLNNKVTKLWFG